MSSHDVRQVPLGNDINTKDQEAKPPLEEKPESDTHVSHISPTLLAGVAAQVEDFEALLQEAGAANAEEHGMSVLKALKMYPKAIAWSFVLSTAIIMEGYDLAVIGSFWAYTPFLQKFGTPGVDGKLSIPSSWQNGISSGTTIGEVIGLQLAGFAANRIGYRWTIIPALAALIGFIFIPFFAQSLAVLLTGEILQGISWGVFQTLTVAYAADVAPVAIRHWLTSWVNTCWFLGQFISAGVLRGLLSRTDSWGYRIPFAIQWVWPVPILIGVLFAPESPWFHVRKGDHAKARSSLERLGRSEDGGQRHIDRQLALLIYTNELEKAQAAGVSYYDCFKGVEWRRTEITYMCWIAQTMCGSALGGLQTYFYTAAGIDTTSAYSLGLGQTAIGIIGTLSSWYVLHKVGRRPLFLSGMVLIFVLLIIVGATGIPTNLNSAESWTAGTMVFLIQTVYGFSIGPVVYSLVGELPSTRVRAKSIVLARNCYNIVNIPFINIITYRQLDANAWNWGSKAGFFWAGSNLLFTVYLYFRLPETKGRTFIELDILFANKVSARQFATTKIANIN